ncbi:MAG: hypothetical protein IKW03_06840 [Clostridia bacterium]|nr:hypothetical protein [Clostridia bacterium]
MKTFLSSILCVVMLFGVSSVAFAKTDAQLYTFYGDGMLFAQEKETVISGTASGGTVTAELYDENSNLITSGESTVNADGTFAVSFDAPAGSFKEFEIVVKNNGFVFETLKNVVFGELWLASGQSNMQYPLSQEKNGTKMFENKEKLGDSIRVLLVPGVNEYKGSTELVPCDPQTDIAGACWVTGNDEAFYSVSAVAYYFAKEMTAELDMPVGIMNVPLGGSAIASWISREAIDGDEKVKNLLTYFGEYYEAESWNEAERSIYYDMTCNFNLKIAPLSHFRPSGMIWYQGETDVILGKSPEQYEWMFDLMQRSYSEHFDCDGLLPVIYTQLAAYQYHNPNSTDLSDMNIGFTDMQKKAADSRAVVSIYDVPLTYLPVAGAIHPECKQQIGERMAFSAKALVYGADYNYTTATVESYEIKDGKVSITLCNTGDGLVCDGLLRGFAVSGKDNIYVQADAVITGKNTIEVFSSKVAEPVSVTYAYALGNQNSNLYASHNGEKTLPVSPFAVNMTDNTKSWFEKQWADCETDTIVLVKDDIYTGEYDAWSAENADVSIEADSAFSGKNGLKISAEAESFSISPMTSVQKGLTAIRFLSEELNYGNYGKISFRVRNDSADEIVFEKLKLYNGTVVWYSSQDENIVIPADGEWHEIEIDIETLYLYGVDYGVSYENDTLNNVSSLEFCFKGNNAELSFDDVDFSPESGEEKTSELDLTKFANIVKVIMIFFETFISEII